MMPLVFSLEKWSLLSKGNSINCRTVTTDCNLQVLWRFSTKGQLTLGWWCCSLEGWGRRWAPQDAPQCLGWFLCQQPSQLLIEQGRNQRGLSGYSAQVDGLFRFPRPSTRRLQQHQALHFTVHFTAILDFPLEVYRYSILVGFSCFVLFSLFNHYFFLNWRCLYCSPPRNIRISYC